MIAIIITSLAINKKKKKMVKTTQITIEIILNLYKRKIKLIKYYIKKRKKMQKNIDSLKKNQRKN